MSAEPQAPGARLKAERERRGLSLQKAADEMRLDAWVVAALEADEYDRVGPAVYAKGHLKKYASLLTLPWEDIQSGYEARRAAPVDAVPTPAIRAASPMAAGTLPRGQLAAALLLLLIVAVVLWWKPWQQRSAANAKGGFSGSASAAALAPGADPGAHTDASDDTDAGAGAAQTSAGDPVSRDAPASAAPVAPAAATAGADNRAALGADNRAALGAGVVRLRMSFSAESWVEVHDAAGHRVFSGYGQANSVKTLVGDGPLRVYLGFASGVQLEINERAVAIGAPFVHADVARFQAGADGVLRSFANDSRPHG